MLLDARSPLCKQSAQRKYYEGIYTVSNMVNHIPFRPHPWRQAAVLSMLCLTLLLSACGGGSGDSGTSTDTPPPTTTDPDFKGPVSLSWTPPAQRENGDELDITELGGYELRYRQGTDQKYISVIIDDPWTTDYYIEWLEGRHEFQIAAFDNTGLYSEFVSLQPEG